MASMAGSNASRTFAARPAAPKVSARRHTPLYRLKTASSTVAQVLLGLAEGLDIAAAGRVFGPGHTTITTWLHRTGQHVGSLHTQLFRDLHLAHVQVDELRTSLRDRAQVRWLWLAVDPLTKTIPVLHLGARTQAAAHTVVHVLHQVLASDCVPIVTSDGLDLYFYALTAHFGAWITGLGRRRPHWRIAAGLLYGQVMKVYRRRRLIRVIPRMHWGTLPELRAALRALGLRGTLNTAFIERVNLTVRRGVAGLARRTWATAQTLPQLQAHLDWWRGYYHFVRPHAGLREFLPAPRPRGGHRQPCRYRPRTPAMALGLTDHRWTVQEVLTLPLPA
jgi:IS1 family transposase